MFLGREISQDLQDLGETFAPNKLNKYSYLQIYQSPGFQYTWKVDAATFINQKPNALSIAWDAPNSPQRSVIFVMVFPSPSCHPSNNCRTSFF